MIPTRVAHGFFFPEPVSFIYGMTQYWDPVNDEFGCRWDDPALGIPWPPECASARLSARDATAGPLDELRETLRATGRGAW